MAFLILSCCEPTFPTAITRKDEYNCLVSPTLLTISVKLGSSVAYRLPKSLNRSASARRASIFGKLITLDHAMRTCRALCKVLKLPIRATREIGSGIISAGRTPTCAALLGARPWLVWCRRAPFPRQGRIIRRFRCLPPHAGGFLFWDNRAAQTPAVTADRGE